MVGEIFSLLCTPLVYYGPECIERRFGKTDGYKFRQPQIIALGPVS